MFKIRIVQADYGDCLILEYGTASTPRFLLIDGGPENVFANHLRAELAAIGAAGHRLDLVAISHVDTDHITGLLDLLAELRDQRVNGRPELVGIDALWHNSFARAIDTTNEIVPQLNALAALNQMAAPQAGASILGIGEGNRVRQMAIQLTIPMNSGFAGDVICVDDAPEPVSLGNLRLTIVGPTRANLQELRLKWLDWLDRFGPDIASGNPSLMANADKSVPNLSSLMFLAEANERTALFTGDGRSDHLLDGLEASGLVSSGGTLHLDVLKVMHHGSDRNATRTFFRRITADTYIVSANGNPDNPDLSTLIWIVETAREQGRAIHLICTNETPATVKLLTEYPPEEYGYRLTLMPVGDHSLVLPLAD